MSISVTANTKDFEFGLRQIGRKAPAVSARALNRSNVTVRTFLVRRVASDMGLKVSQVQEQITKRDATAGELTAQTIGKGRRVPLIEFSAKGPQPSRGRGRGVTARLGSRGRTRYEHAFIATMSTGHMGVFQRKGRGRLPIYELFGPSVVKVFRAYVDEAQLVAREALVKNLESELKFALSKLAA